MTDIYVDQIDSTDLMVQLGDGANPENFAHPCLINTSRAYSHKATTTASVVANCTNPGKPGKTVRRTTATDSDISGEGTLPSASAKTYNDMVGATINIKVNAGSLAGDLVVTGPYILEEFTITGSKLGDLVTAQLKFTQADQPVSTAHA
jgi:hypothetical protein